jgi:hypothetical protein
MQDLIQTISKISAVARGLVIVNECRDFRSNNHYTQTIFKHFFICNTSIYEMQIILSSARRNIILKPEKITKFIRISIPFLVTPDTTRSLSAVDDVDSNQAYSQC